MYIYIYIYNHKETSTMLHLLRWLYKTVVSSSWQSSTKLEAKLTHKK